MLALVLGFPKTSTAQSVFSFPEFLTTLQVNTNQSPAHWYLKIENNTSNEHTLRWKFTRGFTCPAEWEFTFDDQTNYYSSIANGDSADFTLNLNTGSLQKLIIGNTLNNVSGRGSAFFDIYEPTKKEEAVRIEYEFIVTKATTGISTVANTDFYFSKRTLHLSTDKIGSTLSLFHLNGQCFLTEPITSTSISLAYNFPYLIKVSSGNKHQIIKVIP